MNIMGKYSVRSIDSSQTKEWLLYKHYAKRLPSISLAFGLFTDKLLVGVLTIGKPASPYLCDGICGKNYSKFVYELNRLCVNDGLDKNALSFFVSRSLRLLNKDLILVSYADTGWGHHGYIYQATNWVYTGITKERTDIGFEDGSHSRHYDKTIDKTLNRKLRTSKHRYLFIVGNRSFKKKAMKELKYKIHDYPKGQNKRYDASYAPKVQGQLF